VRPISRQQLVPFVRWIAIGLSIVLIGLLVVLLVPERPLSQNTREAVLRTNLEVLRETLTKYQEDHGGRPRSLQELVTTGYLRQLPVDPMAGNSAAWAVEKGDDGTIHGVHSTSEATSSDGSTYSSW